MKRRRPTVTFFAFQDIITAVTGIVILISLILTLQLIAAPQQDRPSESVVREMESAIAETESRLAATQVHISDLQAAMEIAATAIPEVVARREGDLRQQIEILENDLQNLQSEEQKLRQAEAASRSQQPQAEAWQRELADLARRRQEVEDKLAELKQDNRRFYRFCDLGSAQPWLVEVNGTRLRFAPVGIELAPVEFNVTSTTQAAAALRTWLKQQSTTNVHLVLLIRPSGAVHFDELEDVIDSARVSYGYDLITEDQAVLDPTKGAGGR